MKPSLLPCGCDDGTCEECKKILELENVINKTSVVIRDEKGEIIFVIHTRNYLAWKRIMKGK